jgi:hypothetical protein
VGEVVRRRISGLIIATALALAALGTGAQADPSDYGIASLSATQSTNQAGAHPDLTIAFALKTEAGTGLLPATTEEVVIDLPPGLAAYPGAVAECSTAQLMETDVEDPSNATGCPQDSQVGITEVQLFEQGGLNALNEPVFSMIAPASGEAVARFGFLGASFPIVIDVGLRSEGDYGAEVSALSTSSFIPLLSATSTVWGVPADKSHDIQRITPYEAVRNGGVPETTNGERPSGLAPAPFLSNPTRCGVARPLKLTVSSYPEPDAPRSEETELPQITGCGKLGFEPGLSLAPTSRLAAEPTGLDSETTLAQDETASGKTTSALRAARVLFPPELSIAAGAANGLLACSEAEVGLGTRAPANCPAAAKVGVAEIETPVLERPLRGAVYQRTPTPGDLLGLWLVVDEQGLHVKLRGKVDTDPASGQITATFEEGTPQTEGLPQAPVSKFSLDIFGGPQAPLAAPRRCGTYFADYEFIPWSGAKAVTGKAAVSFDSGCDTGGFAPKLSAGSTEPLAGAFAPFFAALSRESAEQDISSVALTLPRGLSAKIAGVALCEGAAAQSGDCPAGSQIGRLVAAAGPGPSPLWLPQPAKQPTAIYLAGPYKGAPYSAITKVPAQAGPFDLGDVINRAALFLDPETAQVSARTDPLPQLLEGIPVSLRKAVVITDRPGFVLNPTNCSPRQLSAQVSAVGGALAHPTAPFGVGGCRGLGFKPRLGFKLGGKRVNRGAHPSLRAVLSTRAGDANLSRVQVTLPRSEFIEQAHFKTICTRVQFAAKSCPPGSVYGQVSATSPLLDFPLRGPVYLRSSSNLLPDVVTVVRGPGDDPLEAYAVGRVDSVNGGVRVSFDSFPDVPISRAVVRMRGGDKGLFVNSRNVCKFPGRVEVKLGSQSGRRLTRRPLLRANCRG